MIRKLWNKLFPEKQEPKPKPESKSDERVWEKGCIVKDLNTYLEIKSNLGVSLVRGNRSVVINENFDTYAYYGFAKGKQYQLVAEYSLGAFPWVRALVVNTFGEIRDLPSHYFDNPPKCLESGDSGMELIKPYLDPQGGHSSGIDNRIFELEEILVENLRLLKLAGVEGRKHRLMKQLLQEERRKEENDD